MIIVAISGASGPVIGIRLIEELLEAGETVAAVVSTPARRIIEYEILEDETAYNGLAGLLAGRNNNCDLTRLTEYDNTDFFAPAASGSSDLAAVVVAPCSMKTLAAIVHGYADSLIVRACDVALKEKRQCLVVPRETPLNRIQAENIFRAARAGIDILPPVPGFYTRPRTIEDVVDFIVGKILTLLGKPHNLFPAWGTDSDKKS